MAAVNILDPIVELWNSLVVALPGIAAAVVVIVFGYLIALFVGYILKEILLRTGFDRWLTKSKLNKAIGGASLSVILGTLAKWWIFVAFLAPAAASLRLGEISNLLVKLAEWLPNLFVGIIIFLFGLIIADYAADRVRYKKAQGSNFAADLVKIVIIIFILIIVLGQLGVRIVFAENLFLIVVAGLVLAMALALGISFGFALRAEAQGLIRKFKSRH